MAPICPMPKLALSRQWVATVGGVHLCGPWALGVCCLVHLLLRVQVRQETKLHGYGIPRGRTTCQQLHLRQMCGLLPDVKVPESSLAAEALRALCPAPACGRGWRLPCFPFNIQLPTAMLGAPVRFNAGKVLVAHCCKPTAVHADQLGASERARRNNSHIETRRVAIWHLT